MLTELTKHVFNPLNSFTRCGFEDICGLNRDSLLTGTQRYTAVEGRSIDFNS
jgi:hypothetical protein